MKNTIEITGKIVFDPNNKTRKHEKQGSWKKLAMVLFSDDSSAYYAWFISNRYNITLNPPLRGPHISFISDRHAETKNWDEIKKKWDGKKIKVVLDLDARSDGKHWWLNIPQEDRGDLHAIRAELGLDRPHFGLHMSIGYANEKNIDHSNYIVRLLRKGKIKT
jgi:hypothetical protein